MPGTAHLIIMPTPGKQNVSGISASDRSSEQARFLFKSPHSIESINN